MSNPFTLGFGIKPNQYISRIAQTQDILEDFEANEPSQHTYLITGVRGSGKTVLMTAISKELRDSSQNEWITIELNPNNEILKSLVAKLYALPEMHALFVKAKLDFSALGFGVSIEGSVPAFDEETALDLMLKHVAKAKKRLLITIDEVTNCNEIKKFASAYQILLRNDYPVFLLMTGLFDNVRNIQDESSLTFLYRAGRLVLEPLNTTAMISGYMKVLKIEREKAEKLAWLTKGYSFAYQALGYIYFENSKLDFEEDMLPLFDQYMAEFSYEKIWSELSARDKEVCRAIEGNKPNQFKDILLRLQADKNEITPYRKRLMDRGIIRSSEYGTMEFALPRFYEFVSSTIQI